MNILKASNIGVSTDMGYGQNKSTHNKPLIKTPTPSNNLNDDTVFISNEAKAILGDEQNLIFNNEQSSALAEMLRQLEESPSKSNDSFDDKLKCILISTRVMNGDNVPIKDMKFLAEKEPAMYANALMLRRKNDKPKKYKSLLEDEEDNNAINLEKISTRAEKVSEGAVSSDSIEVSIDLEA